MTDTAHAGPHFRDLTNDECVAMLERHHVGRLAYTFHDRVDVEPIGFVYDNGGIVFRTAPGSKFLTIKHHPWVALEIDEVKGMFDWQSVVVHGTAYELSETASRSEVDAYHAALKLLRVFVPDALAPGDPTPFRNIVMRLNVDTISGRTATS